MDFDLNSDQAALMDAVGQLVKAFDDPSVALNAFYAGDARLDRELIASGFLSVALEPDYGPLCAALVVEELARLPVAVECMAAALPAPMALGKRIEGPVAIVDDARRPARFLHGAAHAFVRQGRDWLLFDIADRETLPVDSFLAFPMAKFVDPASLADGQRLSAAQAAEFNRWRQIGLCAEASGAMQAAIDFTVGYVTERRQFGRPLGAFQAIQHRLSERTVQAHGSRWLMRHAAWNRTSRDAAIAASFTLRAIPDVVHDCHQFNGALGVTTEHPLHLWTYRLVRLQGELTAALADAGGPEQLWSEEQAA
ncbi:acyl-CoA dehydrogenase family protein [Sphingopyxis sp.]|uniref:acyl-CoA dehydrogenase family protein n=1 Tax=Sphingopyxis sp. TaxID=1908224 RepID=UPI001DD2CAF6|nr:acyl-CoA dehydrogenase family protein [Sphingopyxis sp.]MBW8297504.1 acyl-CoA dehydrogenase [Sphingopyxis sp.]